VAIRENDRKKLLQRLDTGVRGVLYSHQRTWIGFRLNPTRETTSDQKRTPKTIT